MLQLPYAHLNLRRNPFGELLLEERAKLAMVEVSRLVEKLRLPGFVVQFIGEKGYGKTTHLLALKEYFPDAPYFHFPENRKIPPIPSAPVLFLDETQQLPRRLRKRLFRRNSAFAISTHEDHSNHVIPATVINWEEYINEVPSDINLETI
jgi:hypothetical protein